MANDDINKSEIKCPVSSTIFLTQETGQTLSGNSLFASLNETFVEKESHQDWQAYFCRVINYHQAQIPWNLLRASRLGLDQQIKTRVCCDPISIQMTHRGAYCWGQEPLSINHEDALLIVDQINQKLMGKGEQLLLSDELEWIYVSDKERYLQEESYERLIGKDLFDFKYQGLDSRYWSSLATEIQMLIKQMMDYSQISISSSEVSIAVHFWGDTTLSFDQAFDAQLEKDGKYHKDNQKYKDEDVHNRIFSSNIKLNEFIQRQNMNLGTIEELYSEYFTKHPRDEYIAVTDEITANLCELISSLIRDNNSVEIITQDKVLNNQSVQDSSLLHKLVSMFGFARRKTS